MVAHLSTSEAGLPKICRFSSWRKLLNATANVINFIESCRRKSTSPSSRLERAEEMWIRRSQEESFPNELVCLKGGKTIDIDSVLRELTPTLDEDRMLRVRGRIDNVTGVTAAQKRPVILSGKHPYTRLMIQHHHKKLNHGSNETVVNELRQRYWVTNLRPTVRSIARQCQMCCVRRARPHPPPTGDLPPARLAHHQRPFSHCRLDYFGSVPCSPV